MAAADLPQTEITTDTVSRRVPFQHNSSARPTDTCLRSSISASRSTLRSVGATRFPVVAIKPLFDVLLSVLCSMSHSPFCPVLDVKALGIGKEIKEEILALRSGRRTYQLLGLQESAWYEVKISYPASIPASFSIHLDKNATNTWSRKNRRLLNTEKLIFKADGSEGVFVVVTVEAAGIVAKPNVQERGFVVYNIVCDKLVLGIPEDAWWVVVAALLCLLLGLIVPYYLPLHLFLKNEHKELRNDAISKVS